MSDESSDPALSRLRQGWVHLLVALGLNSAFGKQLRVQSPDEYPKLTARFRERTQGLHSAEVPTNPPQCLDVTYDTLASLLNSLKQISKGG